MTIEILAAALGLFAALRKGRKVSGIGSVEKLTQHYPDLPRYVLDELERMGYTIHDMYVALRKMDHSRAPLPFAYRELYDAIIEACDNYADDMESEYEAEGFLGTYETEDVFFAVLDLMQSEHVGDPYPRYTGNGNRWRNMDYRSKYLELLRRGFTEAEAARMAQAIY